MSKIALYTRSFHPDRNFGMMGMGFRGDARGFSDSTSRSVTARIHHQVVINLATASFEGERCYSDPSENDVIPSALSLRPDRAAGQLLTDDLKDFGALDPDVEYPDVPLLPDLKLPPMRNDYVEQRKQPRHTLEGRITPYRPDGNQSVNLRLTYAGKNFAFYFADTDPGHYILGGGERCREEPGEEDDRWFWEKWRGAVPDLDVTHEFSIDIVRSSSHSTQIVSAIGGDGFPNCESFMIDDASATCFLGTHVRIGGAASQLPGGRILPMTFSMFALEWTADNKFGEGLGVMIANDFTGDGSPQEVAPYGNSTRESWNAQHRGRDASGDWLRQVEDHVPLFRQTIRGAKEWVRDLLQ